jgi:hypothetical protein
VASKRSLSEIAFFAAIHRNANTVQRM